MIMRGERRYSFAEKVWIAAILSLLLASVIACGSSGSGSRDAAGGSGRKTPFSVRVAIIGEKNVAGFISETYEKKGWNPARYCMVECSVGPGKARTGWCVCPGNPSWSETLAFDNTECPANVGFRLVATNREDPDRALRNNIIGLVGAGSVLVDFSRPSFESDVPVGGGASLKVRIEATKSGTSQAPAATENGLGEEKRLADLHFLLMRMKAKSRMVRLQARDYAERRQMLAARLREATGTNSGSIKQLLEDPSQEEARGRFGELKAACEYLERYARHQERIDGQIAEAEETAVSLQIKFETREAFTPDELDRAEARFKSWRASILDAEPPAVEGFDAEKAAVAACRGGN
jgi:DNA-binding transcriptional MerR regulator